MSSNHISMSRKKFLKNGSLLALSLVLHKPLKALSKPDKMSKQENFDVIIVGGSYSGLAAGMALGRALKKVLIIDSGLPANRQTPHSHNFLTHDGDTPKAIAAKARHQVEQYKTVQFVEDVAITGSRSGLGFKIETAQGRSFEARKLVFATGIVDNMPDIPGFAECWGISALHCPYCHGYEVRDRKTGILGNGESAFEFAALISNWTADLTVYTNGRSELTIGERNRLETHSIPVVEDEIERVEHSDGYIKEIVFRNGNKVPLTAIYSRRPFVQHCPIPEQLGCSLTTEGYISVSQGMETSTHGVFACGDNATRLRTVANAVAMGTTAGMMVNKQLIEEVF
jgi:thioredoxin reductase